MHGSVTNGNCSHVYLISVRLVRSRGMSSLLLRISMSSAASLLFRFAWAAALDASISGGFASGSLLRRAAPRIVLSRAVSRPFPPKTLAMPTRAALSSSQAIDGHPGDRETELIWRLQRHPGCGRPVDQSRCPPCLVLISPIGGRGGAVFWGRVVHSQGVMSVPLAGVDSLCSRRQG